LPAEASEVSDDIALKLFVNCDVETIGVVAGVDAVVFVLGEDEPQAVTPTAAATANAASPVRLLSKCTYTSWVLSPGARKDTALPRDAMTTAVNEALILPART
jgi:hypothetical protein